MEVHVFPFLLLLHSMSNSQFTVTGRLTSLPRDTETLVGRSVRLQCSTSERYNVNWEHLPCGTRSKKFVYFGGEVVSPYDGRFKVIRNDATGLFDLEISTVELQDSGRYRCLDMEGQGERREAELTILGSPPVCYCHEVVGENSCGVEEEDEMRVSCEIAYAGNSRPILNCSGLQSDAIRTEEVDQVSGVVRYVLIVRAGPQSVGSSHTCYSSVSNIPSAKFTSNITYVKATHQRLTVKSPGVVTCAINSSRICDYRWMRIDENNETVSSGQTLELIHPGLYVCEADCPLVNTNCRVQPIEVEFSPDEPEGAAESPLVIVVIPILLTVALFAIGAIAFRIFYNNRKKSADPRVTAQQLLTSSHS